ncbi:amidohydrolase family protein [Usitatibacter palustris]|uniref:Imidazolonepropionase n=1 Tax=Usitatibacter palustris TaxID=2732487 RepID=A0A6M4H7G6_9PROT|nr:amidohydrolase family protein [Usitatibacter palustris]QJR14838.1 Imidazolonepropionase [Usitatibacter palustris]
MKGLIVSLVCVMLAGCAPSTPPRAVEPPAIPIAIVGATVVYPDRGPRDALAPDSTVVIEGERIVAVGSVKSTRVPANAIVIDGKGKWVIPGLVDSHVHFFQSGNLYTRPDAADFNAVMPYAQEVARNKAALAQTFRIWLASGVTSVADVGGPFWNFEVRDAAAGNPLAPRMTVAGPLISMVDRVKLDLGDPPIIKITSPEESTALAQKEIARKADFIKVWFIHRPGDNLAAQEAIVKAAGDAAHAAGIRLAVHATELVVAKAALRAGADVLVHSVTDAPVDAEFIALAKQRNAIYVPTIFVMSSYAMALSNQWQPTAAERRLADPVIVAGLRDLDRIPADKVPANVARLIANKPALATAPVILENLRKVHEAGITVAMGTDAGNIGTVHGPSVFREMDLMVQAGLTPLQVLRTATIGGAKVMGLDRNAGVIYPGRLADLVILDADPLIDIANTSRIHKVIKGGRIVP